MFKEDHLSFRQRKYMKVKNIIGRALGGIGLVVLSPVYLAIIVAIKKRCINLNVMLAVVKVERYI